MQTVMASDGLKMRHPAASAPAAVHAVSPQDNKADAEPRRREEQRSHPGGAIKHGSWMQVLRAVSFFVYFIGNCTAWVSCWLTTASGR
jgi:lysocardiolipin and lysophospholipid acyltransferase